MRIFKKRFLKKATAIFLLLVIVESIVQPTLTYALTTGPHQPEYISYEQPGATDMVNLLTGDFTFSLPLLEVPGPEGNFSVPLTYNAGIGLDQEASWVGLGWTMNVGSITREINQYPDDASSETQSITNVNLAGVRGWTSAALGLGNIGWNTAQGSYGSISLLGIVNFSYDKNGLSSGGVFGLNMSNGKLDFDMAQFGMAALTISTMGTEVVAEMSLSAAAKATAQGLITNAATSAVFPSQTPNINAAAGYWEFNKKHEEQKFLHKDYWVWLDQTRNEQMYGILNLDKVPKNNSVLKNYYVRTGTYPNYFYYQPYSLDSRMINTGGYGDVESSFYDLNNTGAASDINYYIPPNTAYKDVTSPSTLATDNFSVKGPGITGSIKPYRFDIGSVSMPRAMTQYHIRYKPVSFVSYKVPFTYDGLLSSSYLYHTGNASPVFNFGLDVARTDANYGTPLYYYPDGTPRADTDYPQAWADITSFTLNDQAFGPQRVRPDVLANGYKLPQSNHIEWLSNSEIIASTGSFNNGFMDYFTTNSSPTRNQFRQAYSFGGRSTYYSYSDAPTFLNTAKINFQANEIQKFQINQTITLNATVYSSLTNLSNFVGGITVPPQVCTVANVDLINNQITVNVPSILNQYLGGNYFSFQVISNTSPKSQASIGGFSITAVNGLTYHYSLPVYDYQFMTWIGDKNQPTIYNTTINRDVPFANTWLLTGITGPDFVDRNSDGAIDVNDWGYWVKFNYGSSSDAYQWKTPFGQDGSGNPISMIDSENSSLTYSKGYKQLYYLNSVETRSHIAVFIKDNRDDAYDATKANRSLKLSEIALLKRRDYNQLSSNYGLSNDSGTINSLWMSGSFYSSPGVYTAVGNFVKNNALKRIKFSCDYSLCKSTPNSKDLTVDVNGKSGGKLTLNRVSIVGRNDVKVIPDYKFTYGNSNPTYDANKWDGWGFYNSIGTSDYSTHTASQDDTDGSSWSLSQITTPQGSTLNVNYERDRYSSVSGIPLGPTYSLIASTTYNPPSFGNTSLTIPSYNGGANPGDKVIFNGTMNYSCNGIPISQSINGTYYVSSSSASTHSIVFTSPFGISNSCPGTGPITITYTGTIQTVQNVTGGGVRVSSIVLNDQGQTYKTRYLYTNPDGTDSGVVAQEAPYTKTLTFDFNTLPGYPMTPVMYSSVSVLIGKLTSDADYTSKQVYEFEMPNTNLLTLNSDNVQNNGPIPNSHTNLLSLKNEVTDYTSKIGALKSIKTYDVSGTLVSSTSMSYTNQPLNAGGINQYQGYFSSGTLMYDKIFTNQGAVTLSSVAKTNRTTVIKYPYTLQAIVTSKDGFTSEVDNIAWDFISGQVVEKNSISPLGIKTKTVTQPAYALKDANSNPIYSQMGPKALNPSNKNILAQTAAQYVYKLSSTGSITGLISGNAITWNNYWTYRDFNSSTGSYQPQPTTDFYRKYKSYVYEGGINDVQADGSLIFNASTSAFDFNSSASNANWQQTGVVTTYDHFSLPIESQNSVSKIYSSTKSDFNNMFILASASNATYSEFAYSGAEDCVSQNTFFGGEVALGGGTVVAGGHTGASAVQVATGNKSFMYRPYALTSGRTYRAQVWANSTNGAIYYLDNNSNEQPPTQISVNQVGGWYRIVVDIPSNAIEIGVKSISGTVSFDDFRFQPRDGSLQANVYDASTGYLTYTLGNDNLYTRYQYDDRGIVMKTFIESIKYNGERLVSERKDNFRRTHTDQ